MEITNRLWHLLHPNGNGHHQPTSPAPRTSLEKKQGLLAHHVRLVARRISHGLFCAGPGGLGKSKTIHDTLSAEGIEPVLLNSTSRP